jgi:putative membrane protein
MSSDLAAGERRLHPLSFLFTLLMQLQQFFVPLVAALFLGQRQGNDYDQYAYVGVIFLSIYSIAQYFTYRYRIEGDAVVVRSGVFERNLRHIPFARIQNVSLHQNILHRLFRVAEVRLESAGSAKPEAQMRVLRLSDAQELEKLVRGAHERTGAEDASGMPAAEKPSRVLLALPTSEILRLGVIDNRGTVMLGLALAAIAQSGGDLLGKLFRMVGQWIYGHYSAWHLSLLAAVGAVVLLFLLAVAGLRLLSIAWALLRFHGFVLDEQGGRLGMQRGLFTRVRASLPRHRIQAWTLREGILHRWFGRRSLSVDSAVVEAGAGEKRSIRELAPIATPAKVDELIASLLPGVRGAGHAAWPVCDWQPLHPKAWRRRFLLPSLLVTIASVVLAFWRTPWALLALGLVPCFLWSARNWARYSAWSVRDGLVVFRGGWLRKHWRFAEVRKLQALDWRQSPFDRRWGMATLHFDTAGANGMDPPLAIPYLPVDIARQIYDDLAAQLKK